MDYLKDKQHYIDRYDLATIKECHEMIGVCTESYVESLEDKDTKGVSKGEMAKSANWFTNQILFQIKAERYRRKEESIQKWMDQDQTRQEKYDNTPVPRGIRCSNCKKPMVYKFKHLDILEDPIKMWFIFDCTLCKKKMWFDEQGKEIKINPQLCPKCKSEVEMTAIKQEKDKVTYKTTCSSCDFTETKTDDFSKGREERKKQEEDDQKLLEQQRERFCSEEKGKEAFEYVEALKVSQVVYEEELKKYDSFAYQNVSQLKKLSVVELE